MFRFLRFEIGGASTLVWLLMFMSPYLNMEALARADATKVLAFVFGSISISIPLGNIFHQISDSLLRAALIYIRRELGEQASLFRDQTFQAVIVFSKAYDRKSGKAISRSAKNGRTQTGEEGGNFKSDVLREEISNRYSYYYARIENGAVAPAFGYLLSVLCKRILEQTIYVVQSPILPIWWLGLAAAFTGLMILWRIPQLFKELDDLEVSLVSKQRSCWPEGNLERLDRQ